MDFIKSKAFGWVAFLVATFLSLVSIYFMYSSRFTISLVVGLLCIGMFIYLVFSEEFKVVNVLSYILMFLLNLLLIILIFDIANKNPNSLKIERIYLLTTLLGSAVILVLNYLFLSKTSWRKTLSIITTLPMLVVIGITAFMPPTYYTHVTISLMTRVILVVFFFAIIFKKGAWPKVFGILGMLLALAITALGWFVGLSKPYRVPEAEVARIAEIINPKAEEFINYYNGREFNSMLDIVDEQVKAQLEPNLANFEKVRTDYGSYVSTNEVHIVYLAKQYMAEYKTQFSNLSEPGYMLFGLKELDPNTKLSSLAVNSVSMLPSVE